MGKIINSNALLKLARVKSKDLKIAFDSFEEIRDKPVIEQMLFFCFLNMECLYREQKLSKETKIFYEAEFEAKAQEFAEQIFPLQQLYSKCENELQRTLRSKDYESAIQLLANMLDFSRRQVFEGQYSMMCNGYLEKNSTTPEEI